MNPSFDDGELLFRKELCFPAAAAVFQSQKARDLFQTEPELLSALDEAHPLHRRGWVTPMTAERLRRLLDQPAPLVVTNGFDIDASRPG